MVFLGGIFWVFWANLCKNHGGYFFMGKVVYVVNGYNFNLI